MEDVIDNGFDIFNGQKKAKVRGDNLITDGFTKIHRERKIARESNEFLRKAGKAFSKNCADCGHSKGTNFMCVTCMSNM